jgi:pyruvate ferredoxin oxidoreductase beta subunit
MQQKKDLPSIMAAHAIPYVATATVGFYQDLIHKLERARDMGPGFKYIHVLSPCPPGWRFPESKSIELARLAVETGVWTLYEVVNGAMSVSHFPEERRSVKDYLSLQGRFSSLTPRQVNALQKEIDEKWEQLQDHGRKPKE